MIKLEKKYIKPASFMLAQVFKDDPIDSYAFPNPEVRAKKVPCIYQFILRYNIRYGKVFTTSPKLEGVSVWVRSNSLKTSLWRILISGAIWPEIKIGREAIRNVRKIDEYIDRKHRELVPSEHWYLLLLAVDQGHQGKGCASKLLNEMLPEIDKEGLPCYVDTVFSRNIPTYQHFGFRLVDELIVPDTKIKFWAMLRGSKNT